MQVWLTAERVCVCVWEKYSRVFNVCRWFVHFCSRPQTQFSWIKRHNQGEIRDVFAHDCLLLNYRTQWKYQDKADASISFWTGYAHDAMNEMKMIERIRENYTNAWVSIRQDSLVILFVCVCVVSSSIQQASSHQWLYHITANNRCADTYRGLSAHW